MPLRSQGRRGNRADDCHRPKQKTAEKVSPTAENGEQWRHAKIFPSGDSSYRLPAGTLYCANNLRLPCLSLTSPLFIVCLVNTLMSRSTVLVSVITLIPEERY